MLPTRRPSKGIVLHPATENITSTPLWANTHTHRHTDTLCSKPAPLGFLWMDPHRFIRSGIGPGEGTGGPKQTVLLKLLGGFCPLYLAIFLQQNTKFNKWFLKPTEAMKSTVKDSFNNQACFRAQEVLPMKCFFYKLIPSSQKNLDT